MLKVKHLTSAKLTATLFLTIEAVIFNQPALTSPQPASTTPLCYITLTNNRTVNLNHLCGKHFKESNDNKVGNLSNSLNYSLQAEGLLTQAKALQQLAETSDKTEASKIVSQIEELQLKMLQNQKPTKINEVPQRLFVK